MFEKIIQKILNDILGSFVQGIDAKKLSVGVWSGTIQINNVKLKSRLFLQLGLPFNVIYSYLDKLIVKIPWKSLFSGSLEISINTVLALVSLTDKVFSQQEIQNVIINKINNSIKNITNQLLVQNKNKQQQKQASYLDGVYLKMIDNLDLTIKDVHLRFQNKSPNNFNDFSFGITIQSIQFFSVGVEGEKIFIDRTKIKQQQSFFTKKIAIKSFGIYWKQIQTKFIQNISDIKLINQAMLQIIYRKNSKTNLNTSYLILINSDAKLIQDCRKTMIKYDLAFQLSNLIIKLPETVLKQVMFLYDEINMKTFNLQNSRLQIPPQHDNLLRKYYLSFLKDHKDQSIMNKSQIEKFKKENIKYSLQNLCLRLKIIISTFGMGKLTNFQLLTPQQYDKTMQAFQKLNKQIGKNGEIRIEIKIPQISLLIVQNINQTIFQFSLKKIIMNYNQIDTSMIYQLSVSVIQSYGKYNLPIIWMENSYYKCFECKITRNKQSVNILCNIAAISLLYQMQTISQFDRINQMLKAGQLKNKAYDKINNLSQKVQNKIKQNSQKLQIQLSIDVPKVIFKQEKYTWVIHFGKFRFQQISQKIYLQIQKIKLQSHFNDQSFICIPQFSIQCRVKQNVTSVHIQTLFIKMEKKYYISLLKVIQSISVVKKKDLLLKAEKSGYIFVKENKWRKCQAAIIDSQLYIWQNDKDYPLGNLRIRKVKRKTTDSADILVVGDYSKVYQLAFQKDTNQLEQWLEQFQKISKVELLQGMNEKQNIRLQNQQILKTIEITISRLQLELSLKINQNVKIRLQYFDSILENINQKNNLKIKIKNIDLIKDSMQFLKKYKQTQNLLELNIILGFKQKAQIQVEGRLNSISFEYKPQQILKIMGFFQKGQKVYIQQSDEQALKLLNEQKILTLIKFNTGSIFMNLWNKKTKKKQSIISVYSISTVIQIKYYETSIKGSIIDLQIDDLTNYPYTVYENNIPVQNIKSLPILQTFDKKQINQFTFNLSFFIQGSSKVVNGKYNLAKIEIKNLRLNYIHQVLMRTIDYLQVQLLGVVNFPEYFKQYQNIGIGPSELVHQQGYNKYIQKKEQILVNKMLNSMGKQKVKYILQNQKLLYFVINIKDSQLRIVSSIVTEGVQLELKEVKISNSDQMTTKQTNIGIIALRQSIYKVDLLRIDVYLNSQGYRDKITKNESVEINFEIKYFGKDNEYKFIHSPQLQLRSQINANIAISPINLQIQSNTIHEINKILNLNIGFQDGLDFYMIYDYMVLMVTSNLSINLNIQAIVLQVLHDQKTLIGELGNLYVGYQRKNDNKKSKVFIKHCLMNFGTQNSFQQIISSRKTFGRSSSRRTLPKNILSEIKDNSFAYQSSKTQNNLSNSLLIKQILFMINLKTIQFLYNIIKSQAAVEVPAKFRKSNEQHIDLNIQPQKQINYYNLSNIIICYRIPEKKNLILCLILSSDIKQQKGNIQINLKSIQSFISSQQHISCQDISLMRKRTLLKQTSTIYKSNNDKKYIKINNLFIKCSLTDLSDFSKIIQQVRKQNPLGLQKSLSPANSQTSIIVQQKKQQFDLQMDTVELMVINDLNQNLTPLIFSNFQPSINLNNQQFIIKLYIDYYNIRNSLWEPLVENSIIKFTNNQKLQINLQESQQLININVSTNFIQNLLKTLQKKQLKVQRKFSQFKTEFDIVNSWILINDLGYQIFCQQVDLENSDPIFIQKGESKTLPFFNNQQFNTHLVKQERKFITIKIKDKFQIKKINVSEVGVKKLTFNFEGKPYQIIKQVFVDIGKNVRFISLSSLRSFENCTSLDLSCIIGDMYISIPKNSLISIPFDKIFQKIRFDINESNEPFEEMLKKRSVKIFGSQILLKVEKKKLSESIKLLSPYKFSNFLPYNLIINFKRLQDSHLYQSMILTTKQNYVSDYFYDNLSEYEASIYIDIDGYQCTPFTIIQPGFIKFHNYHKKMVFNIVVKCISQQYTKQYVFYPQCLIKNGTDATIKIYSLQRFLSVIQPSQAFILSSINSIKIQIDQYQSELIYLNRVQTEFYIKGTLKNDIAAYYPLILIEEQHHVNSDLKYSSFNVQYKYILKNNCDESIIIRGVNKQINNQIILQENQQIKLYWFNLKDAKSKPKPNFVLTFQHSNWEWSAQLSVQKKQKINFILMDRSNNNKKRYMQLKSVTIKNIVYITISILDQKYIPFIIRNQTQNCYLWLEKEKIKIQNNSQIFYSWENPLQQSRYIYIALVPINVGNFQNTYVTIDTYSLQQQIVNLKKSIYQIKFTINQQIHQKIIKFTSRKFNEVVDLKKILSINLGIRLAIINNTLSPAYHLLDINTKLQIIINEINGKKNIQIQMKQIQIDNQTKFQCYFPVVLTTSINIHLTITNLAALQIQLDSQTIYMKIQQDFAKDLYATMILVQSYISPNEVQQISNDVEANSSIYISRIKLPKLSINLQIQTKKLSIETVINLQKPAITTYPWETFPYPIRTIAINLLSHLSISPWAFITSLNKGFSTLLSEQSSSRAFEGFFSQIIGSINNSVNGMVGILIGHDVERVDNFIDGVDKGAISFFKSLGQITESFEPQCSVLGMAKNIGMLGINLVVKPIKGVLRMTLKISEGIKKTTKFSFSNASKQLRQRNHIIFYGRQQYFKPYNHEDDEIMLSLHRSLRDELKYLFLVGYYRIGSVEDNMSLILVLGSQQLILFSLRKQNVQWRIDLQNIRNITQSENRVLIHLNYEIKSKNIISIQLPKQLKSFDVINNIWNIKRKTILQL